MKPLVLAWAVAALCAAPATAQSPSIRIVPGGSETGPPSMAAMPELDEGEMLLQVNGEGETAATPDRIVFAIMANGQGATDVEAEAAVQAKIERLRAALRAAGVSPDALVDASMNPSLGFIGNEAYAEEDCGEGCEPEAGRRMPAFASRQLRLTLRDAARFETVNRILNENEVVSFSIDPQLDDDSAARREAIALAIADARREAADYAAALGYRIVRTIRIADERSDRNDWMTRQMMRRMQGEAVGGEAIVGAHVIMDVVVAPE